MQTRLQSSGIVASAGRSIDRMDTVFPTIPQTAAFRIYAYYQAGDRQRYFYPQFNFLLSGAFASGYTYYDWENDMNAAWTAPLNIYLPPDVTIAAVECFYQFGTSQMQMYFLGDHFHGGPPTTRLAAAGAAVFLRTAIRDKRHTGRTHFPFLLDSDRAGSYLSGTFAARIAPFYSLLLDGFVAGGVTHKWAVWSRAGNFMTPVVSVDYARRIMYLSHRRLHGDNWAPPMEMYHHGLPPLPP